MPFSEEDCILIKQTFHSLLNSLKTLVQFTMQNLADLSVHIAIFSGIVDAQLRTGVKLCRSLDAISFRIYTVNPKNCANVTQLT